MTNDCMETEGMSFGMGQKSKAEECLAFLATKTDEGTTVATAVGVPRK